MGRHRTTSLVIVAVLFLLTSFLVYFRSEAEKVTKDRPLSLVLGTIDGWKLASAEPLSDKIVEALKLDDYLNNVYVRSDEQVSLYIGYYFTKQKIGAAHDPLVCFPGQGWQISTRGTGNLAVGGDVNQEIRFSEMIIDRGLDKMFIVYWFQAHDRTAADTFSQKIIALLQKYRQGREDNAFVRISVPMKGRSAEENLLIIEQFINSFYPTFLDYVMN